jgi:hypothetical protein
MENKTIINDYQNDFDSVEKNEKNENFLDSFEMTNVPDVLTLEKEIREIRESINQLAMFVGVPRTVRLDGNLSLFPARKNGIRQVSNEAISYIVDLKPYRGIFAEVRFEAINQFCDDEEIVRGIIIDEQGKVECASNNKMNTTNTWTRLPLTRNSAYLVASLPLKNGKPDWTPENVEFLPNGLAQEVASITHNLYHDALDTYNNDIVPLKLEYKSLFSKLRARGVI